MTLEDQLRASLELDTLRYEVKMLREDWARGSIALDKERQVNATVLAWLIHLAEVGKAGRISHSDTHRYTQRVVGITFTNIDRCIAILSGRAVSPEDAEQLSEALTIGGQL